MNYWTRIPGFVAIAVLASSWPGKWIPAQEGQQSESAQVRQIDFVKDVQPIFVEHCLSCHGSEKQESNFRLDSKNGALGTGDLGDPPIIPGNANESPLYRFVAGLDPDLIMPPEGENDRLNDDQLTNLRKWIDRGANWPDHLASEPGEVITTNHWSFQPLGNFQPPEFDQELADPLQVVNEIDSFILRRLLDNGLQPSLPADRVTLIRRIYLDMHGLLPTPEQVQEFVNDSTANAYSKLIDDVLANDHYGQRWARHWLDVVRFGESTGYEVNRDRANAYYYRDYVIDSLNEDKSYRDFIIEQLAGDVVGVDEATGFLVGGPYDIVKSPDINLTLMQRQDELADYVNTTSTAFLGLTVGCARCHNHKFDPILQRDYYALQAVFAGVEHGERKLVGRTTADFRETLVRAQATLTDKGKLLAEIRATVPDHHRAVDGPDANLLPAVNAKINTDPLNGVEAKFVRFTIRATSASEPCIDELEIYSATTGKNLALAESGGVVTSSGDFMNNPKHQLQHVNDGKTGNDHSWISNTQGSGWLQIEFPETVSIDRVVWGRDREGVYSDRLAVDYAISVSSDAIDWQEVSGSARRTPFPVDGKEPDDAFILQLSGDEAASARQLYDEVQKLREQITSMEQSVPTGYVGNFKDPQPTHRLYRGDPLAPREEVLPDTLVVMGTLGLDSDSAESARRLKLAQWIAADDNPLTARVIVNRVWHYHFGQGIVTTPSDFGKNGAAPSHPELLDWLARRFMENGWSLKWLHRQILSSGTYRQSSRPIGEALALDAGCRFLWRFPPRRLEAEAIRDCVLQITGKLNPKTGGPGFLLFKIDRENVHHYFPLEEFAPEHYRRMIYMTKIRQEQDDVFGVFDCPDGGQTIPDRNRSTTALQALNLLNSRFMIQQADILAERLVTAAGDDLESQIRLAFELAFSRPPTSEELADAREFVGQHDLQAFCRALLNANEFLFMS